MAEAGAVSIDAVFGLSVLEGLVFMIVMLFLFVVGCAGVGISAFKDVLNDCASVDGKLELGFGIF